MAKKKTTKKNTLGKEIAIGGVSLTDKAVFARHLSVMLKSGLTLTEALEIAQDSAKGKFKNILGKIRQSVESGNSLSESFKMYPKVFSGLFINVTHAGEVSGTLVENLENIAAQLRKEYDLISKIKSAMAYPVVVFVAAFFLSLGMAYFVLPQITPLFSGLNVELPLSTRIIIFISEVVRDHGLILFPSLFIGIGLIIWLAKQKFTNFITHWLLLKIPIIKNISSSNNLVRFNLTLGTLLKSGLNIDEALVITQQTLGNTYYRQALKYAATRISRGSKISGNLVKYPHLFPKLVTSMIRVGEESGSLEETLLYLADFYEVKVDNATKTLTTALEPMLLIVIGLVVATLALAIITPIYEITGNLRR